MKENNVVELSGRVEEADALSAMLRAGAQELIRQAADAELHALLGSDTSLSISVTLSDRCKARLSCRVDKGPTGFWPGNSQPSGSMLRSV